MEYYDVPAWSSFSTHESYLRWTSRQLQSPLTTFALIDFLLQLEKDARLTRLLGCILTRLLELVKSYVSYVKHCSILA